MNYIWSTLIMSFVRSDSVRIYSTMGWLWLVGSLKLYVSFAKDPYKRDNILQKKPIILRSLLIVATPYDRGLLDQTVYACTLLSLLFDMWERVYMYPLMAEIRLNIFGSPDLPDFWIDLLSDGDFVYSPEPLFEFLGTPEKTCLICVGTPVKTSWKFWQS